MTDQTVCAVDTFKNLDGLNTIADRSYAFGAVEPEPFELPFKQSLVQSAVMAFEAVVPHLSGKPLLSPKRLKGTVRKCCVYLIPEAEGGFSIIAADLPGVASQGETEEEAIENICEAYAGAIRTYKQEGESVPWLTNPEAPEPGSITRAVVVHG